MEQSVQNFLGEGDGLFILLGQRGDDGQMELLKRFFGIEQVVVMMGDDVVGLIDGEGLLLSCQALAGV